jgi:glycosyltransferase involved in cell wall biosynthesis
VARPLRLLYLVSEDWYFVSHRIALASAAKAAGFEVSVATRVRRHGDAIRDAGLRLIPITFARSGMHPLHELRSIEELLSVYGHIAPDIVHNVAVKPVLYGSLAAQRARSKAVINALMGLGWVFSSNSVKARILQPGVKFALRRALSASNTRTIVQNAEDAALLAEQQLASPSSVRLIRGSGVDPGAYTTAPPPSGPPLIVLPARLLLAKGVREFMQAAAILKSEGSEARFALVGEPDTENPAAASPDEIERHVQMGHVEYWGWRNDMPEVLSAASIVCLPTFYGEGLPKCLLEAAASARAIVTTDVAGCRDIVRPSENGWLVPPRDISTLATALREAIAQPDLCRRYGLEGRRMVEREFSLDAIIGATLATYEEAISKLA